MGTTRLALAAPVSCGLVAGIAGIGVPRIPWTRSRPGWLRIRPRRAIAPPVLTALEWATIVMATTLRSPRVGMPRLAWRTRGRPGWLRKRPRRAVAPPVLTALEWATIVMIATLRSPRVGMPSPAWRTRVRSWRSSAAWPECRSPGLRPSRCAQARLTPRPRVGTPLSAALRRGGCLARPGGRADGGAGPVAEAPPQRIRTAEAPPHWARSARPGRGTYPRCSLACRFASNRD